MITKAPILAHHKQGLRAIVEINSSNYVSSGVSSQLGEDEPIHLVAFFSTNLISTECNYEIYDKELQVIIRCFEQGKPELKATEILIKMITNYKNLKYFLTTKKLLQRQAHLIKFGSGFNFIISYILGKKSSKADLLICRPNDYPANNYDDGRQHQLQIILLLERLEIGFIDLDESETTFEKMVLANLANFYCLKLREIIKVHFPIEAINTHHFGDPIIHTKGCICRFYCLWVPDHPQLMVIRQVHD